MHMIERLFTHALTQSASDIHIEPLSIELRIRLRIDGLLQPYQTLSIEAGRTLINCIKIKADLDITETRLPQDGRFQHGQTDCRVSTCPILHGEKLVIRLLNPNQPQRNFAELGFSPEQQSTIQHALTQSQGLLLVTGPTGSGKTNTLYAGLTELNTIHRNIISIENPIEMTLAGINQIAVNEKTDSALHVYSAQFYVRILILLWSAKFEMLNQQHWSCKPVKPVIWC